ncbi:MAG: hypothetical protein H0V87_07360 [Chloroflexi bacterium]|nr:hypothetical protein [Chloroflexota bacterium]
MAVADCEAVLPLVAGWEAAPSFVDAFDGELPPVGAADGLAAVLLARLVSACRTRRARGARP